MRNYIRVLLASVLLLILLIPFQHDYAQSNLSFGVSPAIFPDLVLAPGQNLEKSLTIYNTSDHIIDCTILIKDYKPVGQEGKIALQDPGTQQDSLSAWINLNQTQISVQPHDQGPVNFVISIPFNAEPGGRYASIVVKAKAHNQSLATSTVGSDISSLIFLTIPGDITLKGNLQSFNATNVFDQSNVNFSELIQNTGNVHFHYSGTITIKNIFNMEVGRVMVNDMVILPNATRISTQQIQAENFWGPYSANLTISYKSGDKVITQTSSQTFWAIPVIPALITVLFILLIVLYWPVLLRFWRAFIKALKSKD